MAQVKALQLGGIGHPCCCTQTGCRLTVNTKWCQNSCVAPGTITVTAQFNNSGGAVADSQIADASGNAVLSIPTTGNFYITASNGSGSYLNTPVTVNITSAPIGSNCTPATARCRLYPNQLTITESLLGVTATVVPTGSFPQVGAGSPTHYIGSTTYSYPGTCTCPAKTVTLYFFFDPCTNAGITNEIGFAFNYVDVSGFGTGPFCPDDTGPLLAGGITAVSPTGTGPELATCYNVNLSGSGNNTTATPADPPSVLYGFCIPGTFYTENYTVTQ